MRANEPSAAGLMPIEPARSAPPPPSGETGLKPVGAPKAESASAGLEPPSGRSGGGAAIMRQVKEIVAKTKRGETMTDQEWAVIGDLHDRFGIDPAETQKIALESSKTPTTMAPAEISKEADKAASPPKSANLPGKFGS